MSVITARFSSICPTCRGRINAGERIEWQRGSKGRHVTCASYDVDSAYQLRSEPDGGYIEPSVCDECHREYVGSRCSNCDYQYAQGIADGRRYSSDREIYGAELAEQFAMQDEMNAYNRGEDY